MDISKHGLAACLSNSKEYFDMLLGPWAKQKSTIHNSRRSFMLLLLDIITTIITYMEGKPTSEPLQLKMDQYIDVKKNWFSSRGTLNVTLFNQHHSPPFPALSPYKKLAASNQEGYLLDTEIPSPVKHSTTDVPLLIQQGLTHNTYSEMHHSLITRSRRQIKKPKCFDQSVN